MTFPAGTRLGPYEILAPIGAGGMGEVFKARDTRLQRLVAVKVLAPRVADDPEALARFEREARTVAALSHPNILAIHDVGREGGIVYAVMELLEGETLRARLAAGPLSAGLARETATQIARALAAAHERGIVHRDLKPENVFLTNDGLVKVLDFGLARHVVEEDRGRGDTASPTVSGRTRPGTVLGTAGYMAPEQVRGQAADARADVFAFGAVLYEMLAGARAFPGETAMDAMVAIVRDEPKPLPGGEPLAGVALRCLEKEPDRRFSSGRDLAAALQVIPASGASSVSSRVSEPAQASIAVLPFRNVSGNPESEYFSDGITEDIINALMKIDALRVAARTSSFAFKGQSADVRQIGERLGVRHVLEGSVRQAGGRLRVTAQ
ncbi:MAG TPA: serine/threonine-protein kinase, partial [Thermoanaerobaculia bacterium]|nr:serine/threonine-protein kinase [Thermoanaerobaculia bacterium]